MVSDIEEIVQRETTAWDTQDVDLLLSIFHSDMVWVWPKDAAAHNPIDWETPQGKFDHVRWKGSYSGMFSAFSLEKNDRKIVIITETAEQDGGFAVVDIDTLWKNRQTGETLHWLGRTCKTYVKTNEGYKMIAHHGVLQYD